MHNVYDMEFWNRSKETAYLKQYINRGGFGYVTGRRRVGKTALLRKITELVGGAYHQAVEGTPQQQILHLVEEIKDRFSVFQGITPKSWTEFFHLLARENLPSLLIFDEFSYWIRGDPTLPSIMQKWVDHELPKSKTLVLISGSSQAMLYSHFLNHSSPLYGRASFHLHLEPMSYYWFSQVLKYDPNDPLSFERFSLVGGVPYYWKLMFQESLVEQANRLYFEPSAILAEEPSCILRDEGVTGNLPRAILDFVGRGVRKPSELASRLGTVQGNLSRPLSLLMDLGMIQRELPFGESIRTTKRVLYRISDPALLFYYSVYLPNRSRWDQLELNHRKDLIHQHASQCWENFCRQIHQGSGRYWEGDNEFDLVYYQTETKMHLIAECKWTALKHREENEIIDNLKRKFDKTLLRHKLHQVEFRVLSKKDLPSLVKRLKIKDEQIALPERPE